MGLTAGEVLDGKYRVGRLLGEGGMGAVYEGEHILIRRRVAIKALRADVATADIVQRFEREAQAAGTIGNDHILEVMDLGRHPDGTHYMVMEYLDGETLSARIRKSGRLSCESLALIVRQVLTGLGAAHDAGIIHRDLKPDNIFILREKAGHTDFIKLIDFGISRFTSGGSEAMRVTQAGALLGTPVYMSPEQARGKGDADTRTDLYSLGVIMYEAVSGVLPFDSNSFHDLLFKIVLTTPAPLQDIVPGIDTRFAAMIAKAMAREPNDRYQASRDFARDLDEWMRGRTIVQGSAVGVAFLPRPSSPEIEVGALLQPNVLQVSGAAEPASSAPTHDSLGQGRTWAATQSVGLPAKKRSPLGLIGIGLVVLTAGVVAAVGITRAKKSPVSAAPSAALVASAPSAAASNAAGAVSAEVASADPPAEKAAAFEAGSATTAASAPAARAVPSAGARLTPPSSGAGAPGPAQTRRPQRPPSTTSPGGTAKPGVPDLGY